MPVLIPAPEELDVLNNLPRTVVKLYTNAEELNPATQLSDMVEANFDGYAAVTTPPWGPVESNSDVGRAQSVCAPLKFTKAAGSVPNVVQGYYIILNTTAGPVLIGVFPFPRPVNFVVEGDTFSFGPVIQTKDVTFPS